MAKSKFSLAYKDEALAAQVEAADHKILGRWAMDCVMRVLPCFEERYPEDHRPRNALDALQAWIDSGVFRMEVIRRASLESHKAAREVGEDNSARSAARAAGQAVATAHVPAHAIAAANYALQAIHRAAKPSEADAAVAQERAWQRQRLWDLGNMPVRKVGE